MSTKQLYEKTSEGMKEVSPLVAIEDIYSKLSDTPLEALVSLYNHVKCEWKGSVADTRRTVPLFLRRSGLFITYNNGTKYITEFFSAGTDQITTEGWVKDSNWTPVPDEDYISAGVKPGVGTIGYEQLSDNLKQLFREKVNVTNFPDDEDIASVDNMLKLKDREADSANFQSKGYVILRKNLRLVNGVVKNILTQNMINKHNTIYEIRYDFDLNGQEITIPEGCVLDFQGGSLKNGIIYGNSTTINALCVQIFYVDIELKGSWRNIKFFPEWYGAKSDIIFDANNNIEYAFDSTNAFRATFITAFNNHFNIVLSSSSKYYVTGNNPFGLEYFEQNPEDDRFYAETKISFFLKEGLIEDNNRNRYRLNLLGNNAIIYWKPENELDCFAFVGYLRWSMWENLYIHTVNNSSKRYGDIFSTDFRCKPQAHLFSCNNFKNIVVSGGCRRLFSFDSIDDIYQAHDDLSIFENISCGDCKVWCYINNNQAVGHRFISPKIGLNVDNAIGFYITSNIENKVWTSGLTIVSPHITISDCNNAIIIKEDVNNAFERSAIFKEARLEIINTATNWKYFDLNSITLYADNLTSITIPSYQKGNNYGIIRSTKARAVIKDTINLFQPFALFGDYNTPFKPALEFTNCTFMYDTNPYAVQSAPIIKYYSKDGSILYNIEEVINSEFNFGDIKVNDCFLTTTKYNNTDLDIIDGVGSWHDNYIIQSSLKSSNYEIKRKILSSKQGVYNIVNRNTVYKLPFDIIISQIDYKADNLAKENGCLVDKIILHFPNKELDDIEKVNTITNYYDREIPLPLIAPNKELYLKAGTNIQFKFLDDKGNEKAETAMGITHSEVRITYRHISTTSELKNIDSMGYIDKEIENFSENVDGTKIANVVII